MTIIFRGRTNLWGLQVPLKWLSDCFQPYIVIFLKKHIFFCIFGHHSHDGRATPSVIKKRAIFDIFAIFFNHCFWVPKRSQGVKKVSPERFWVFLRNFKFFFTIPPLFLPHTSHESQVYQKMTNIALYGQKYHIGGGHTKKIVNMIFFDNRFWVPGMSPGFQKSFLKRFWVVEKISKFFHRPTYFLFPGTPPPFSNIAKIAQYCRIWSKYHIGGGHTKKIANMIFFW